MKKICINFTLIWLLSLPIVAFNFTSVPQKIAAHYVAKAQELEVVQSRLQENGFQILAISNILEGQNVITITNQELQKTNSYMATLQINVNAQEVRVQNPSYLAAAYLNNYTYGQFKDTIEALERALGALHEGNQKANFSALKNYNFMYGLPRKEDILVVTKDSKILEKIAMPKAKHYIAYTLKLPNGNILVGHKLRKRTNQFLNILAQEKNAQVLPYEAMIIGDEVSILNPKYYLALSFPELSLAEFMEIASVPDQIYRNIKRAYH
jgi:hypothetical protein